VRGSWWRLAPGAVAVAGSNTGSIHSGPTYVQVTPGGFDRVQDAIFDPAPLAEQLDLARFQGRAGLIARIDERVAAQDRGYVVIRGEAGVGKSALAAHLVWTRPCGHHFTRLGGGARNPVEARKSLAAQLIGGWGLADRFTPGDVFPAAAERPDWLAKVIRAAADRSRWNRGDRPQPLVLVVDGLDEAEPDPPGMGTGIPLGLPAPDDLPDGVYIVATSRHGLPLSALRDPVRVSWSQIEVDSVDNLADMAAYLRAATGGSAPDPALTTALARGGVTPATFTTTLIDRCAGVWIYLRYVLDEIRAGLRSPIDVACLPDRLRGYYEVQIRGRWAAHPDWERLHLPALAALAALLRPATAGDIAAIIGSGRTGRLIDWFEGPARAFLDVTTRGTYQIRHQSLRDMFTTPPAEDLIDAALTARLRAAWTSAHRQIAEWLEADWAGIDDYTRLHLPGHAAAGGTLDRLMTNPRFLLACTPGQILRHRHALTGRDAISNAAALELTATGDWTVWPETRRAWELHLSARRTRCTVLAESLIADHPGWPWHVQNAIWSGTSHRVLSDQLGEVTAVVVLPGLDGAYRIVSGSEDGTLRISDPDTGTQLAEIANDRDSVWSMAVLPDYRIVTGSQDGRVRVWDLGSGTPVAVFSGHNGRVTSIAVLPGDDGNHRLVTGSYDETARVWDLETGTEMAMYSGHTHTVGAVAVLPGPDGTHRVVTGSTDGTVAVWDPDTGTELAELIDDTDSVWSLAVLPGPEDSHRIITGNSAGVVRVWNPETGDQLAELVGDAGGVDALAALPGPNGTYRIVSGHSDGHALVWDPGTGRRLATLEGHVDVLWSMAVLPAPGGAHRIVTGGADGTVRVWEPDTGTHLSTNTGVLEGVSSLVVLPDPDGTHRIVTGDGRELHVWDPNTGALLATSSRYPDWINAMAVLPCSDDANRVVIGGQDGTVGIWDPRTGCAVATFAGHTKWVTAVAVLPAPDGAYRIVSSGGDGTVRVWDPNTGAQLAELISDTETVEAVAVLPGPDGAYRVVTGNSDGTVCLWDPLSRTRSADHARNAPQVHAVAVLPDPDGAHRILTGNSDRTVRVWDPDTGAQLAELVGHTERVIAVAALPRPDGTHLVVSGGEYENVRVWDPDTGAQLAELTGHRLGAHAIAALPGPDGTFRIVTGGMDGVFVWAARG
jgi:WD40 repeat protein